MIAALYVAKDGAYYGISDVDPWDEERDARRYAGPWPVVAHPPCSTWCQLASVNQARYGHQIGADGGCFEAALKAVRTYGGVLEHPAYSIAWARYGLPEPAVGMGWQGELFGDGWTCHVEQGRYGHPARKATWLYAVGAKLPELDFRPMPPGSGTALVSFCKNHLPESEARPRLSKKRAKETPPAFRDALLQIARSCGNAYTNR